VCLEIYAGGWSKVLAFGGDFGQQLFVLSCVDVVACDAVCGLSQHLMSVVIGTVVMSSYSTLVV
jgi:hypothetical protein